MTVHSMSPIPADSKPKDTDRFAADLEDLFGRVQKAAEVQHGANLEAIRDAYVKGRRAGRDEGSLTDRREREYVRLIAALVAAVGGRIEVESGLLISDEYELLVTDGLAGKTYTARKAGGATDA